MNRGNRCSIHEAPWFREIAISSETRSHPCPPSRKSLKATRDRTRVIVESQELSQSPIRSVYSNRSKARLRD